MRQIVLDTETTGLEAAQGHRIIEIGCVELVSRRATGRHFHHYLNPEREVDEGARAIHGMSLKDLAGKPRFAEVAVEFTQFIGGAELIIHNAGFDVGFLDAELARLKAAGVRLIDESPRKGAHGNTIAFLHPKSTGGVLIELCEPASTA